MDRRDDVTKPPMTPEDARDLRVARLWAGMAFLAAAAFFLMASRPPPVAPASALRLSLMGMDTGIAMAGFLLAADRGDKVPCPEGCFWRAAGLLGFSSAPLWLSTLLPLA